MSGVRVVEQDELPFSLIAREFVGEDHGGAGVCILLIDAEPGRGPGLHTHPYEEIFILQEGRATFVVDDREHEAEAGQIVVVPPGSTHRFVSTGDVPLRQISIHVNPHFVTDWLED